MKKIVFVCSHLFSGSSVLCDALNSHPRVQKSSALPYNNTLKLFSLTERRHKLNNRSAVYMDELLCNQDLCISSAYSSCKFIYVIREPEPVLQRMVRDGFKPCFAASYYTFRLRRMCEMAKRTPGALLLTWDDLVNDRAMPMVEKYLELRQSIPFNAAVFLSALTGEFTSDLVGVKLLTAADSSYQKYLYWLRSQTQLVYS